MKLRLLPFLIFSIILFSSDSFALKIGDKAPDFSLQSPTGGKISLYSILKPGKVVFLDFWASWCGPCREANKGLCGIYNTFHSQGFEVFSVSLDKKKEPWMAAMAADKLVWPYHGCDFKEWDSMSAMLYQIDHLPSSFLIDENGIIIGKEMDEYDLEKKLTFIFLEQIHFYPQIAGPKIVFTSKAKYEIFDQKGVSILKGKGEEADLIGIPEGEYKIKYEDQEGVFTKLNGSGSVTFFPERADDKLTLSEEANFEVMNVRGRLLKKGRAAVIDVSDLNQGVYLISINGNISRFFKK